MQFTKQQSLEAQAELKELFTKYQTKTVFVVQRSVSRSGMSRALDLYILPSYNAENSVTFKNEQIYPLRITYLVAQALQWTYSDKHDALLLTGCGMDMHFHTVYSLSSVLFPELSTSNGSGYYLKHETI